MKIICGLYVLLLLQSSILCGRLFVLRFRILDENYRLGQWLCERKHSFSGSTFYAEGVVIGKT